MSHSFDNGDDLLSGGTGDEIRLGNQTLAVLTAFDTTTLTQNNFTSV
ncbi:hypothetical protein [Nostoc sp. LEGE 12450]|nr:hypothetical protein [Nostoc sp. LEGE 12450]MBE8991267.1 hypothetical protein [Nostoc sp. LEGE 12450]